MNSSRMNKLEELGRVDAEKADTSKGKKIFQTKNLELLENLKLMVVKLKKEKKLDQTLEDQVHKEKWVEELKVLKKKKNHLWL